MTLVVVQQKIVYLKKINMKILFICGHSAENVLVLNFLNLVDGVSYKGHQLTFWYLNIPYRISRIKECLTSDNKLINIYKLLPPNKLSFFIFDRLKRVSYIIYNDLLQILNIDVKKLWHQTSRYYEHDNILADMSFSGTITFPANNYYR